LGVQVWRQCKALTSKAHSTNHLKGRGRKKRAAARQVAFQQTSRLTTTALDNTRQNNWHKQRMLAAAQLACHLSTLCCCSIDISHKQLVATAVHLLA
jgi:hypothetical protein